MPNFPLLRSRNARTGWDPRDAQRTNRQSTRPCRITTHAGATFHVSGTTVDSTGAALASCVVQLFRTGDDTLVQEITSDGSGAFTFTLGDNAGNFYIVAYKAGGTDVAGTTVNTLVAV